MTTERATDQTPGPARILGPDQPHERGRLAATLSAALLLITLPAATLTLFAPQLLTGPAAMIGSARGTALVALAVGVPALLLSLHPARAGSQVATAIWLGTLGYLTYNSIMFVFATPYNALFLLYVAMLGLSVWSLLVLMWQVVPAGPATATIRLGRPVAVYLWLVAGLNALVWLAKIIPSIVADRPGAVTDGMGVATNPVYVQDLAIWLPAAVVVGLGLWRRRPWGGLLAGAVLVLWFIEAVGVAVDQWFGATADPASAVTSISMVPAFAGLAAVDLVPLWIVLRGLRARGSGTFTSRGAPT